MNRLVALCAAALSVPAAACHLASNGPAAFERSQQAAMRTDYFNVEIDRSTRMGEFKDFKSIDCSAQYFHELDTTELSDFGIEQNVTLSQGRPKRHRESELMFTSGKNFGRNTSSWENPSLGTDDAYPDWHPISASRDPKEECQSMKTGSSFGFVAYDKALRSAKIEYAGKQWIDGRKCAEYQTSYPDRTYADSKICLGTKDDLPYRVVGDDFTVTYNYDKVNILPAPQGNPPGPPQ
jgi:hypothetical protein